MTFATKEDYVQQGRRAVREGVGSNAIAFVRSDPHGRAKAFYSGYDDEKSKCIAAPERRNQHAFDIVRKPYTTSGWPGAAAEHAYRLSVEINDETSTKRRDRLLASLGRLQKRHGAT